MIETMMVTAMLTVVKKMVGGGMFHVLPLNPLTLMVIPIYSLMESGLFTLSWRSKSNHSIVD